MPRSSRKRGAPRRRRSTKRTVSRVTRPRRSLGRLGKISDNHHFKETVNAGVLGIHNTSGDVTGTGVWVMQLTDFPIFQRFNECFEFCRLNKCTIEFIPKFNMQLYQTPQVAASVPSTSITGTLITAIDQVPFNVVVGTTATAPNWTNDSSNTTGTTSAAPYASASVTPGYVRGLQGSREKELYKKHTLTFMPAFYDYLVTGGGFNTLSGVSYERKVKKWVTTHRLEPSTDSPVTNGVGPIYYGPVYAFDVNEFYATTGSPSFVALYDVRMRYSMSFKRLRGV